MRDGMHARRAKPRHPTISTTLSVYANPAFQPLASGRGPLRLAFGETRESDSRRVPPPDFWSPTMMRCVS